jgi:hypothetical protein
VRAAECAPAGGASSLAAARRCAYCGGAQAGMARVCAWVGRRRVRSARAGATQRQRRRVSRVNRHTLRWSAARGRDA